MGAYAAQERVHEPIQLLGGEKLAALQHAHCEAGDDGEVLLERGLDDGAEAIVVFDGFELGNGAECFEGFVVELVHVREVLVGYDYVWELLHVADAVREAGGELGADIIARV